jgi:hypothetical protein
MTGVIMTTSERADFYTVPGSYSVTIDRGTRFLRAWVQAAGGSGKGRTSPPIDGSAGGGGGYAFIARDVQSTEWGNSLTIVVGAGSAGNNGGNSTFSGTVGGGAVSVTCNGGTKGTTLVDGAGGSASGGDTNISGESGFGFIAGPPGDEAPGTPGRGGGFNQLGAINYELRGPGEGGFASSADEPGQAGYVILRWL